ncbi:MAG: lipoprotein [Gammaproteobacteria bacterium]|jgi:predicted small lipoprotein YifL
MKFRLAFLLLLAALAAGCGQKGPLYLPKDTPAAKPAPADPSGDQQKDKDSDHQDPDATPPSA